MHKLLKNVDEESWNELKVEAARHRQTLSAFLASIVREHQLTERKKRAAWDVVLNGKKHLTDADAAALRKALAPFEKEHGFEG